MANSYSVNYIPSFSLATGLPAASYYFKAYQAGGVSTASTTYTSASDNTGGTKFQLNSSGQPASGGTAFAPHFRESVDAWIFPTSAEADTDDTSNAVQVIDASLLVQSSRHLVFNTVAAMAADTGLVVGDRVRTLGYASIGDGGGNDYNIVAAATGTNDGGSYIDLATYQAKGLFLGGQVYVKQFGATGDGVTDDTSAFQAAINYILRLNVNAGTFLISAPLTKDATGFKLLGNNEGTTILKADAGFTGSYMLNLGNGTVSRYFNDIRYISFDGNSVSNIVGLYLNRVNNQSKIFHNQFQNCAVGIKGENLALSNICKYNKFGDGGNTIDIQLVGTAGNSWTIEQNYFTAGGYVYLNGSMTDVKYINNVSDGDSYLLADGASGQRGCQISGNRFENTSNIPVQLGLVRGQKIHDNYFTGSSSTATAIQISSSSSLQNCSIESNWFENFTTTYITASSSPADLISLFNNTDDGSATMFSGNRTATKIHENLITENDSLSISASELSYYDGSKPIFSKFINKTGVTTGSAQSFATITVPATEEGAYTIAFEGIVGFASNSTATASIGFKKAVSVTHNNAGTPAFGVVSDIYLTDSAAGASGTRDISTVVLTTVNTSDTVCTLQINIGVTGTGNVDLIGEIKAYWEGYSSKPSIVQV